MTVDLWDICVIVGIALLAIMAFASASWIGLGFYCGLLLVAVGLYGAKLKAGKPS